MERIPIRIVFMGTPEFAVASLDALLKAGCDIAAVVTAPDKPAGRGQKVSESAVKAYARMNGLTILQPEKLKDPSFIEELRSLSADLFVVVAFRMLPEVVWSMPPKGTINLHGSLLPRYRGAAPIHRAVMNGERETGVSTFFLSHDIDTGNIIDRTVIPVGEDETTGELHDRMMLIGAQTLVQTVRKIAAGTADGRPQSEFISAGESVVHAPKIFRDDARIDWSRSAAEIHNFVRGLSPYPAAWTLLDGKVLKLYKGRVVQGTPGEPGQVDTDHKSWLRFACADGWYEVLSLQSEGKKRMEAAEFLKGWRAR